MDVTNTRLRYIMATDLNDLIQAVNSLPFKIEIKGAPAQGKKKWVLFFVIPDSLKDFNNIDLG